MSHYPLHTNGNKVDTSAALEIFDTLQTYGEYLEIVFLWGHNHRDVKWDQYVEKVALPGETIRDGSGGEASSSMLSSMKS
jgi:hypothetical protein